MRELTQDEIEMVSAGPTGSALSATATLAPVQTTLCNVRAASPVEVLSETGLHADVWFRASSPFKSV
jgi:hypothetical protein